MHPPEIYFPTKFLPFFLEGFRIILEIFFDFGYFYIQFYEISLIRREHSVLFLFHEVTLLTGWQETGGQYCCEHEGERNPPLADEGPPGRACGPVVAWVIVNRLLLIA